MLNAIIVLLKATIVFYCLLASYFFVFCAISGNLETPLGQPILYSIVFSVALLIACIFSRGRPWRAFWIANIALTLLVGGLVFYEDIFHRQENIDFTTKPHQSSFTSSTPPVWLKGHINAEGVVPLAAETGLFVFINFLGFFVARGLIAWFDQDRLPPSQERPG